MCYIQVLHIFYIHDEINVSELALMVFRRMYLNIEKMLKIYDKLCSMLNDLLDLCETIQGILLLYKGKDIYVTL